MASEGWGLSDQAAGERPALKKRLLRRSLAAVLCGLMLPPMAPAGGAPAPKLTPADGRDYRVVDCLVIEPTMQIGRFARSAGRQKLIRASVDDCMTAGGQFALDDGNSVAAAVARWRPAAEAGDPDAQTRLADLLKMDVDGGRDPVSAAAWYAKAAAKGHKPAQYSLARLYEEGAGVAKDTAKANEWYAKAFGVDPRRDVGLRLASSAEVEALQARISSQSEQLKLKDGEIAALKQDVSAKQAELTRITQAHAEDLKQIALLQTQLADQRSNLSAALDKGANSLRDLASRQGELEAMRKQIVGREAALATREQDFARRQSALTQDTTSLLAAKGQLDSSQKEILSLRQELEKLRTDLALRASETRDAGAQNDKSRAELAALRIQLETRTRETAARETALIERERTLATAEAGLAAKTSASAADTDAGRKALDAQRRDVEALRASLSADRGRLKSDADAYQAKLVSVAAREETARAAEARYAALLSQVEGREAAVAAREAEFVKAGGLLASQRAERDALDKDRAALQAERTSFAALKTDAVKQTSDLVAREQLVKTSFSEIEKRAADLDLRKAALDKQEMEARKTQSEADSAKAKYDELLQRFAAIADVVNGAQRGDPQVRTSAGGSGRDMLGYEKIPFGRFHAILIGNEAYNDPKWERLDTPLKDVAELQDVLTKKYGFDVSVLKNATRDQIMRTINETAKAMGPTDNLLIYYAGHGRKVGELGYWEPVDSEADQNTFYKSIPATDIYSQMSISHARKVLVISDSCFSGNMVKTRGPLLQPADDSQAAQVQAVKKEVELQARLMIASGNTNENVADGGGRGHSVFAQALIDELKSNSTLVKASNVFLAVRDRVNRWGAPQTPIFDRMPASAGDGGGDFLFVPAAITVASR